MKTLINKVTVQIIEGSNKVTVFTEQPHRGHSYDGFNVYDTEEEALDAATKLCKTWSVDFQSTTKTFEVKRFFLNGDKTVAVATA